MAGFPAGKLAAKPKIAIGLLGRIIPKGRAIAQSESAIRRLETEIGRAHKNGARTVAVEFGRELTDKILPELLPAIERGLEDYSEQEGAGVGMPPLIHAILHARKLGMEVKGIQSIPCVEKMGYLEAAISRLRQEEGEARTAQDAGHARHQAEANERKLERLRGIYRDSILRRIGKTQPDIVILLGETHQAVMPSLGEYRHVSIE